LLTPEVEEEAFTCATTADCSAFPAAAAATSAAGLASAGCMPLTVTVVGDTRDEETEVKDAEF